MENEDKKPELNKTRVITALKNWSPFGLCDGTLVQANGERKKTEACSIGCLALEFATSRSGRRFFQKHEIDRKKFISKNVYNRPGLGHVVAFKQAVQKYFGLDDDMESAIMSYNDGCVEHNGKALNDEKLVPASVQKTIFSLRKRFEKFEDKRAKDACDGDCDVE